VWARDKFTQEQLNDPQFEKMMKEKMTEINVAYDKIKEIKKWGKYKAE
jgi:hypothetical protein